ncbi:MAG TPA: hypothetical protein VIC35_03730 [Acidimicrobiia bacterium]|jgi:hypothetical protein
MDIARFVSSLERLSADDLRMIASAIDDPHCNAAAEVAAWEDLIAVDGALRATGRGKEAARAAHEAVKAVRHSAEQSQVLLDATAVTRVAREAAVVARALVAGEDAQPSVTRVYDTWRRAVPGHAAA